jgi:hypothetical protein
MNLEQGFIAIEPPEAQLLDDMNKLGVHIFAGIPHTIVKLIQRSKHPHKILTPETFRQWLREPDRVKKCDIPMAMRLLAYVSEDERMDQLYELPLFACRDMKLRSLRKTDQSGHFRTKLYLGTLEESTLFDKTGECFLKIETYPPKVSTRLRVHIKMMSASLNLEMFNLQSFQNYTRDILLSHPSLATTSADVLMSAFKVDLAWIQKLWNWLDTKDVNEVAKVVQSLWLIPLEGQSLRKVSNCLRF